MNVKGKSINDLLTLDVNDFNKLNRKELAQVVSRLSSVGNKRISRLNEKNINTPALESVTRSGGKFSTKGKDLNQLRAEYVRAKNFLNSKTSTIKGYNKFVKDFKKETGIDWVNSNEVGKSKMFWSLIGRLREIDPNFVNMNYKEVFSTVDEISENWESKDLEESFTELLEWKTKQYEETESMFFNEDFIGI